MDAAATHKFRSIRHNVRARESLHFISFHVFVSSSFVYNPWRDGCLLWIHIYLAVRVSTAHIVVRCISAEHTSWRRNQLWSSPVATIKFEPNKILIFPSSSELGTNKPERDGETAILILFDSISRNGSEVYSWPLHSAQPHDAMNGSYSNFFRFSLVNWINQNANIERKN